MKADRLTADRFGHEPYEQAPEAPLDMIKAGRVMARAFQGRASAGFRKTISGLAWGSLTWFVSGPDRIVIMRDGASSPARLASFVAR